MTAVSDDLRAVGEALGRQAQWNAPLGARTTYRVGGTAAILVEPEDEDELLAVAGAVNREIGRASCRERVFGYV